MVRMGGTVPAILSDGSGNIYAGSGTNEHGFYRSEDGGLTFGGMSSGIALQDRSVDCIVLADSGHILIGTNSHIGARIYRSENGGETWTESGNLQSAGFAKTPEGHLLVSNTGFGSMHRSIDNGHTWEKVAMPLGATNDIAVNDTGHVFVAGWGYGRSRDSGATWDAVAGPPGDVGTLAIDAQGRVYAGNWSDGPVSGIYRSSDNGASFSPLKLGFRVNRNHNIIFPAEGHILVGSWGQGIWKSTDDGSSWYQANEGLGHLHIRHLHITAAGIVFAGTEGGGIYRSGDAGETWRQVGIPVATASRLVISPETGDLFAAVSGVSRSSDAGQSWEPVNTGLANLSVRSIAISNDGTVFAGMAGPTPHAFRSEDGGETWIQADAGLPGQNVYAMAVGPNGWVYAGNGDGVYESGNNGGTWTRILEMTSVNNLVFNANGDLFASSWGQGIQRRLHGETTWTGVAGGHIYSLFVASNGFLYSNGARSEDNGDTWSTAGFEWSNPSAYAENALGNLFAGTTNFGSGVYRSTNHFETWEQVNSGIPTGDIRALALDAEGFLYAAARGYSVFRTTLTTTTPTEVEDDPAIPTSFWLGQNYPNPFNPSTTISYALPRPTDVVLTVYDLLSREIRKLQSRNQPAGTHGVSFNATGLPSGVYFYRLQAGDYVETKRMVVVK